MSALHFVAMPRAVAATLGLKQYPSDRACPKGHIGNRYTRKDTCAECERVKLRRKYANNPEAERERHKQQRLNNLEAVRERNKEYQRQRRKTHPEVFTAQEQRKREKIKADPNKLAKERQRQLVKQKKAYQANPEKYKTYSKERREIPEVRERMKQQAKEYKIKYPEVQRNLNLKHNHINRLARKHRVPCWLTEEDKAEMTKLYKKARELGMHVDHIIPLQGKNVSGLHVPQNLQLLTRSENCAKKNRYEVEV